MSFPVVFTGHLPYHNPSSATADVCMRLWATQKPVNR
jgi:hypothetical protein